MLIVEGEKDVVTAAGLSALAVTNADGAGKWTAEDTRTLIGLGVRKVIVCPDNDGAGIDHGIRVAKFFQSAGVETRWLELPELGAKEDLSDWAPHQADPTALLAELIDTAPPFDAKALDWRSHLKAARPKRRLHLSRRRAQPWAGARIRTAPQGLLRLERLSPPDRGHPQDAMVRARMVEARNLTPVGNRALRDADITKLGDYVTHTYDFGACVVTASRAAINAMAEAHIFDELKDWIDARPEWDGVARLDNWLATYAGADTEAHAAEYLALIGSKYIMQALNRALHPGAKADYSLVFTAPQGVGKDRMLEAMFSPYYREGVPSPRAQPGRLRTRHRRSNRRARCRDVGVAQVRRRGSEGGADALRRPRSAGLRLRDALLSAAHLPRLLDQRRRFPAGRHRRPPVLAAHNGPRAGRHRGPTGRDATRS